MSIFNLFKREQVLYAPDLTGNQICISCLNAALSLSHETQFEGESRLCLSDVPCFLDLDTELKAIRIASIFGIENVKNGSDEAFLQFCNTMNSTYRMVKLTYEKDAGYIICGYDHLYSDKINLPDLNAELRCFGDIIRDIYSKFAEQFPEEETLNEKK